MKKEKEKKGETKSSFFSLILTQKRLSQNSCEELVGFTSTQSGGLSLYFGLTETPQNAGTSVSLRSYHFWSNLSVSHFLLSP